MTKNCVFVLMMAFLGTGCPLVGLAQSTSAQARMASWEAHKALDDTSPFRGMSWRAIGPLQAGARVEAIAVPPGNHGIIYAGIGSGNLWKTISNGTTWTPIFDNESTFTIGDVAVSASEPDVVWVGTGETQPRPWGYSYAGTGVFRSTDAGASWEHKGLTDTHHIGKVLIDPRDANTVFVAAIGHFWSTNEERGVFRTRDGGDTWEKVLYRGNQTGAIDIVMDPRNSNVLYAGLWQTVSGEPTVAGENSGVYRSKDGGDTWSRLQNGLPKGPLGRMGLEISPSNPDVVYAFIDNRAPFEKENEDFVGGELYRSDNAGDTWHRTHDGNLAYVFGTSGWKHADVRVSPTDPNELFVLGTRAYRSFDGGRSFEPIGEDIVRLHDTRGEVMHLDHHEIWIDPQNPNRILLGNDGGLFQSYDGGDTWLHHNNIPAAEFYSVSVDQASPYNVYGGTQDNAALYGPSNTVLDGSVVVGSTRDPWENVYLDRWTGGDSFDTLLDPTNENEVYFEHQHGAMMKIDLSGKSVQSGGESSFSIRPRSPEGEEPYRFGWYTPIVISHHDPRTLYSGSNFVLKSTDKGNSWRAISPDLSDESNGERAVVPFGTITFVAESPFDPDRIWVSTEGGTVWRTDDGGKNWLKLDAGLPDKWASRLIASSHNSDTAYLALSGFREDDFSAYLFRSTDAGESWTSIVSNLPAETINVITEDPRDANVLYVGTDLGVFTSLDGGGHWVSLSASLPTTPVHDLVVHTRDDELVIGTHGRSVFVLDAEPIRAFARVESSGNPRVFAPEPALLPHWEGRSIRSRAGTTYGEAIITYAVPSAAAGGNAIIRINDANGDLVSELEGSGETGIHVLHWDLKPKDSEFVRAQYGDRQTFVAPGVYSMVLTIGTFEVESSVTVLTQ
jgi:photosystem II stability/assembly factor-like uncharacterized protein